MLHGKFFEENYGIFDSIDATYDWIKTNPKNQLGRNSIQWMHRYMDTLYEYASRCDHITEFGINQVVSTWAFLKSKPKKLISVDIDLHKRATKAVPEFSGINWWLVSALSLARESNIDFKVIEGDTAEITIESTDLLFIDTLHSEEHLTKELVRHKDKVGKYIILHDTVLFPQLVNAYKAQIINTGEFEIVFHDNESPGLTIFTRK